MGRREDRSSGSDRISAFASPLQALMGFCQSLSTRWMTRAAIPLSCPLTSSRGYFVLAIIPKVEFQAAEIKFLQILLLIKVLFPIVRDVYWSATVSNSN